MFLSFTRESVIHGLKISGEKFGKFGGGVRSSPPHVAETPH